MSFDLTQNIRHHGFKRLLLAVSGGLDSICLAHYFIANREALGIEWLGIAHVHHGLRVGTADRDAAFVETFARKYNVPFFLKKLDGEALKNAEGSLEENARDARYKALIDVTLEAPSDYRVNGSYRSRSSLQDDTPHTSSIINHQSSIIVTAHHAGDQAETMYMRLRRGTTLAGLRGIQEVRVLDEASHTPKQPKVATPYLKAAEGCDLIPRAPYIKGSEATDPTLHTPHLIYRPFLSVTRADLLSYAREHNLTWCEDESNTDVKFARNKTRHEYLPHLEETNPGATMQLCKVARLADKAYAKVMEKCNELFNPIVSLEKEMPELVGHDKSLDLSTPRCSAQDDTSLTTRPSSLISLNKKALRKIFLANADADLSEMFRLWLSEQGFRFPIGFFYSQTEPAHVKIPVRAAYRKRAIAKNGSTVRICEFESVEAALKFVSCK